MFVRGGSSISIISNRLFVAFNLVERPHRFVQS